MALPTSYKVGTVSVSANGTVVTGSGTLWTAARIEAGDLFAKNGLSVGIASVDSPTQITLDDPWPGAALNDASYEIRYTPDANRVLTASREAISSFEQIEPRISVVESAVGPSAGNATEIANQVTSNPNSTIRVNYDAQVLPADFPGVLLEYTKQSTARNINQSGFLPDKALRTLRGQHPGEHADVKWSTLNVETKANGSRKNGPGSADYGATINVAKRGYSSGSAASGEIDGITIYVRQDGPDGLPSAADGSSDAAGILANVQNIGTVGFVAVMDATASNITRDPGFPTALRLQVQAGVVDANNIGGKVAFGYTTTMKTGQGRTAFHAGAQEGGSWQNLLDSPATRITWAGDYLFRSGSDYSDYAARLSRPAGLNSQLAISNKGTGGVAITAEGSANINFGTSSTVRMQVSAAGNFQPFTDLGADLGAASRRWGRLHTHSVSVYGSDVTLSSLQVHANNSAALAAGLDPGRVYRTATGQMMVVY